MKRPPLSAVLNAANRNDTLLDLGTIQSIARLTGGRPEALVQAAEPPAGFVRLVERADSDQINGMLIGVLRRWHELQCPVRRDTAAA